MKWGWVFLKRPEKCPFQILQKFYVECDIEFDSLGLKYKEHFNKSLTFMCETT